MSEGRHRVDWLLGGAIAARTAYGFAMVVLIPLMVATQPLLLTLLSGSTVGEVVLGARVRVGEIGWLVAIAAGVPIWVLTDWLYWAAGRRWGDRALVRLIGRRDPVGAARRAAQVERFAHRFGPLAVLVAKFQPLPGPLVYAAAGTGGIRLPVFLALNAVGATAYSVVMVTLGHALGRQAIAVVDRAEQYAVAITVVVAVLLTVGLLARRRPRRRPLDPPA